MESYQKTEVIADTSPAHKEAGWELGQK